MISFLTLLSAGVLAGFEIGVHYGLGSPPLNLTESSQILLRQAMTLRLRILAPALFLPTLALALVLSFQRRHSSTVWLDGLALASLLIWILIRIVWTVPVNSATLEWSPENPPAGWRERVERTERFHVVAAWAVLLAFVTLLVQTLGYH